LQLTQNDLAQGRTSPQYQDKAVRPNEIPKKEVAMSRLILGPIIGGLSSNRAYLWGRSDSPATLYAWLGEQPDLSDARLAGQSLPVDATTGFAGVAPLNDLSPDRRYYYTLTLSDAPPRPHLQGYPTFTTFPPSGSRQSFAFAFGSCFRPAGDNGGQIFHTLDERRQADDLRFLLMIGDQIYADAFQYNGIGKIACTLQEYRDVYAYTWSRSALRRLLANLPAFMTLDDHEVDDDWRWLDRERRWATIPWWDMVFRWLQGRPPQERHLPLKRVQEALQAYWEHQGMHAPAMITPPPINPIGQYELIPGQSGSLAYNFTFGAAAFFVLDTRTMRMHNQRERSMLGEDQWTALETWLLSVKDAYPVKFLVTSSSLLYNMLLDFPADRWSGFPRERDRLLHLLAANGIEGVYLLAGDLHSAHAVRAGLYGPQGRQITLWEFCSTPFEQAADKLSRYLFSSRRFGPVESLERIFTIQQNNFGVVRVDLDSDPSRVTYEVYGEGGELLASAGD
jgi:alkaline phosphatase D